MTAVRRKVSIRTADGILIDKAPVEGHDPFAAFDEWAGEHDEKAYGDL